MPITPSLAASGRAAELEWARGIQGETPRKKVAVAQKREIDNLKAYTAYLEKKFANKTPKDLKNERTLARDAISILNTFKKFRRAFKDLLEKDIKSEKELEHLFNTRKAGNDAYININRLNRTIAAQEIIEKEIDAVVAYWEDVKKTGKLPFWSSLNKKMIRAPLEKIKEQDMALLSQADHILKMAQKQRAA